MATLSDIKRRISSVKNTQQITKAMKMVSAAKLRRAQEGIEAARPYASKIKELMDGLSKHTKSATHPLLSKGKRGKVELIVVTSDRGLCGGFNTNILRAAEKFIRENPDLEVSINILGRRAVDYFKRREYPVIAKQALGNKRPDYGFAEDVADKVIERYLDDSSDETYIIYGEFVSAMTQNTVVQKILPVVADTSEGSKESQDLDNKIEHGFTFEPSEEEVLASLLPKYVIVQIFRAILDSSASEHGARMTAMESASRNASDMIAKLTLIYNRARQAAITKELMEIIGGAEALKG
ncbi:MAG: ATP synthase F1 subunit gamma [Deltaproteobacteria bacterium]|nr:ATP synthase F1 subunit gamma [Deltaproteobacteria bacterium]